MDYYDPGCRTVTMPLDPALSAARNAKYYKGLTVRPRMRKNRFGEQIEKGEQELEYMQYSDALSARPPCGAESCGRSWWRVGICAGRPPSKSLPSPWGPWNSSRRTVFRILVGRNNVQNDRLTLKTAQGAISGSIQKHSGFPCHCADGGTHATGTDTGTGGNFGRPPFRAADSRQVPVDYTELRHVRSRQAPGPVWLSTIPTAQPM